MVSQREILSSVPTLSLTVTESDVITVVLFFLYRSTVILTDVNRHSVFLVEPFVQCSEVPITLKQGTSCRAVEELLVSCSRV